MKLFEEIELIFAENQKRISLALIMEVAEDIIDFVCKEVATSEENYNDLKTRLMTRIENQVKTNKVQQENADKS